MSYYLVKSKTGNLVGVPQMPFDGNYYARARDEEDALYWIRTDERARTAKRNGLWEWAYSISVSVGFIGVVCLIASRTPV